MPKKKRNIPQGEPSGSLASLGDLLKLAGFDESEQKEISVEDKSNKPVKTDQISLRNATIHKERKGRKGKTVTVVGGIDLDESGLEELAKKMRKTLGCGSHIDNGTIVLQGDLVDRARSLLIKK